MYWGRSICYLIHKEFISGIDDIESFDRFFKTAEILGVIDFDFLKLIFILLRSMKLLNILFQISQKTRTFSLTELLEKARFQLKSITDF